MKIAVASDNKRTISHHFGRALGFVVFNVENGEVIHREYRENIGKSSGECGSCDHPAMIENVKDCEFVISYGMGQRIFADLVAGNIKPIVTEETTVDEAVAQLLKNKLTNRIDKLH